jgi:hypothetical protein
MSFFNIFFVFLGTHAQVDDAVHQFELVEQMRKRVKVETWVVPYARYELGMLWCREDDDPGTRSVRTRARAHTHTHTSLSPSNIGFG